jgi:hypothetical protein
METDDDLSMGEFGIATRMVQGERPTTDGPAPAPPVEPGATMIYRPRTPLSPDGPAADVALAQEIVTLTVGGKRREVTSRRVVIGRSKDCDVQLADPNACGDTRSSARRARPTARSKLESGDVITSGSTELLFERMLAE